MGQGRSKIGSSVVVERSGGVAGMRLRAALSESDLGADDARRLRELIAALEPATSVGKSTPPGVDRFSYEIAVTTDEGVRRASGVEGGLPSGWRAIVSFVMAHGQRQQRPPDK